MIRRFETYGLAARGTRSADELTHVLGRCGRAIAEVLHNGVGRVCSRSASAIVWEHAFASPAAYRRYMVHPYHAEQIDRLVLTDSPERVVDPVRGAGLFGYHCDEPSFAMAGRARRVVLLRIGDDAAAPDVRRLEQRLERTTAAGGGLVSSFGTNTLAAAWFDGETPIEGWPAPKWSHVWEQGFADLDALVAYTGSWRPDWRDPSSPDPVLVGSCAVRSTELAYVLDDDPLPDLRSPEALGSPSSTSDDPIPTTGRRWPR